MTAQSKKTCFFATPIGEAGSDVRSNADRVLKDIIRPSLRRRGFSRTIRPDEMPNPGIITQNIIQSIYNCDLLIADLTGENPNVYYELSLRHSLNKPSIQIAASGTRLPFDISPVNTVFYSFDHEDVMRARSMIAGFVDNIFSEDYSGLDNPISLAGIQVSLNQSNPEIAQIFRSILENLEAGSSAERLARRNEELNSARLAALYSTLSRYMSKTTEELSQQQFQIHQIQGDIKSIKE